MLAVDESEVLEVSWTHGAPGVIPELSPSAPGECITPGSDTRACDTMSDAGIMRLGHDRDAVAV